MVIRKYNALSRVGLDLVIPKEEEDKLNAIDYQTSQVVTWATGGAQPTSDADRVVGSFVQEGLDYLVTRITFTDQTTLDIIEPINQLQGAFQPVIDGIVYAIALNTDGSVLIGGSFTGYFRKLNADGSEDTAFTANLSAFDNAVYDIKVNTDGTILVAGQFSHFLRKLNIDGTDVSGFSTKIPFLTNAVRTIAINTDGTFIIGGDFQQYRLKKCNADGSEITSFASNAPAITYNVYKVAINPDGTILVGGAYAGYLKKLAADGTEDSVFAGNLTALNNVVYAISINTDGTILIGGSFTNNIKKLNANGTDFSGFTAPSLSNGGVRGMSVNSDGTILITGGFPGKVMKLAADGTQDASFTANIPYLNSNGFALAIDYNDSSIYVGGQFTNYLRKLNADGTEVTGFLYVYMDSVLNGKVDKVTGKGLSTEDFTTTEKKIVDDARGRDDIAGTVIDFAGKSLQSIVLTADTTVTFSNLVAGKEINLSASGAFAITWPAYVKKSGAAMPYASMLYKLICVDDTPGSEYVIMVGWSLS